MKDKKSPFLKKQEINFNSEIKGISTVNEISELLRLAKENNLEEFKLEMSSLSVYFKFSRPSKITQEDKTGLRTKIDEGEEVSPPINEKELESKRKVTFVKSPLVGTFYRKPAPDSKPFVEIGDKVEPGQTVCIIETMKIMNEITSPVSGEISKILVEDGKIVEVDQPLFEIETYED